MTKDISEKITKEYNRLRDKLYSTLGKEAKEYNNLNDRDIMKLTEDEFIYLSNKKLLDQVSGEAESINMIETIEEKLDKPIKKGIIPKVELLNKIPKTSYPGEKISGTAKVNNLLFNGKLNEELQKIGTESRGRKELTVKASIDMEQLEGIKLSNKNITAYDREVHDAIVSLYIDGENRYITPLMVYRTMTGNRQAKFSANGKNFNDIVDSIEKCSKTRVHIDATDEADGYNMENPILKENLIYTRSVSAIYNGEKSEWIEILSPPILYKYADSKDQVARMDIKLLNTPINKNEENIILQGYLQRRIQAMQGSKLSRNILYETIYKKIDVQAKSDGALRKKKSKVRDTITKYEEDSKGNKIAKGILPYWKEQGFIKNFKENTGARNSKISITITL